MNKFCKDVLEFLRSEYNDAYEFNIDVTREYHNTEKIELTIRIGPGYKVKITDTIMRIIYKAYRTGVYIPERNQYLWQKELIDIIEGS